MVVGKLDVEPPFKAPTLIIGAPEIGSSEETVTTTFFLVRVASNVTVNVGAILSDAVTDPVFVVLPAKSLTAPAAPILTTGFLSAAIAVPNSK